MRTAEVRTNTGPWDRSPEESLGTWTFEDHDRQTPEAQVKATGATGEFADMFEDGTVKTLLDFRLHVIGSRGTRYFTWKDED